MVRHLSHIEFDNPYNNIEYDIPIDQQIEEKVKEIDKEWEEHKDKIINLKDLVNENFYPVFREKDKNLLLSGGRSSLKSSVVSLKLVTEFLEDDNANIVTFRKVASYLSISVYAQILWSIRKLGVEREFIFRTSPLKIIHKRTKTGFYFYGVDDPQKIKSTKIVNGYVKKLWFEEGAEFANEEELDMVSDTFIRENAKDENGEEIFVQTIITYNPPRNPFHWINKYNSKVSKFPDWLLHHSTYLEDKLGFLSKQFLRKVKRIAETDPDYHDWMYLGKVKGYGDLVYNSKLIKVIDTIPSDDRLIMADIALDTGYSISATTFLYIGFTLKGRIILLDTWYYSPEKQEKKKAPSEFSKELNDFIERNRKEWKVPIDTYTIDSADGALRNQFDLDYNIALIPARKKTKKVMTSYVEDLLANGRLYVLSKPSNDIFLIEHEKYQWDPKTKNKVNEKGEDDPKVIKEDDHTCDAFQYYVMNNLSKLGLRF